MTHVVNRHVVVLTPKEWHRIEPLTCTEHVLRSGLALALGYHPMLYANPFTCVGIGPTCCIPCGKDSRALVSRYSFTAIPRSILKPACSAKAVDGRTPTPRTRKSASMVCPPVSVTLFPSTCLTVSPRWKTTPCDS